MADLELSNFKRKVQYMGFTMESAAEKLKISKQTMYNNLNKAKVDPDFAQKVKSILGVDIYDSSNNIEAVFTVNSEDAPKGSVLERLVKLLERMQDSVEKEQAHNHKVTEALIEEIKKKGS